MKGGPGVGGESTEAPGSWSCRGGEKASLQQGGNGEEEARKMESSAGGFHLGEKHSLGS